MRFFNFFLIHMAQKYLNEISPIFHYGKSPKTNEKDLKILILRPPDWGQPYWMTRYIWIFPFGSDPSHSVLGWRDDARCGPQYPLVNGEPAGCYPHGRYPCCSTSGWCGNTNNHCDCPGCINYYSPAGETIFFVLNLQQNNILYLV